MTYFPDEVLEYIFDFVKCHQDRNAISLVCKSWYRVERFSREKVFIGNCYAVSPEKTLSRFPKLRSLTIKGKPHFADFHQVPRDWGGFVYPWIEVLAKSCVDLHELRLKRMVVSDASLVLISNAFVNFKILNLVHCEGFTTVGISAIASNCRFIEELNLHENDVDDHNGQWLSFFPESCTSLVSLNFACLKGQVNLLALERLVKRCPNLTSLRLNNSVPVETLHKILKHAPQLIDLGIASFVNDPESEVCQKLKITLLKCTSIRTLSGFVEVAPRCLSVLWVGCKNLTALNLSYAPGIHSNELVKFIHHCSKLQRLWILDRIGDEGLRYVASVCKDLQELKVFPSNLLAIDGAALTEAGLVAISTGCQKLRSILYFCKQMTNAALITVSKNCPNFTHFRLSILDPTKLDPTTSQPLDEGFGAIVQSCKGLKRLSVSGLLTDKAFLYIGMYGEQLETLSIAFAGESDKGLLYVLNGCKKLKKLEIKDSLVGNGAFLGTDLGTLRSIWMSSCGITVGGCKAVAAMNRSLNLELINENEDVWDDWDNLRVEKVYLYRTVVGPRTDAPHFVWTL